MDLICKIGWKVGAFLTLGGLLAGCAVVTDTPSNQVLSKEAIQGSIVFQSGLGDDHTTWSAIAKKLPSNYHAVFYDRPGYGAKKSVETQPRDPCTIARELHEDLKRNNQKPPYLLVGHSIGGLYQYAFGILYPSEVMGMVLIDPTHPNHLEQLKVNASGSFKVLNVLKKTFSATAEKEFDDQANCNNLLLSTSTSFPSTTVLYSTTPSPLESAAFLKEVYLLRKDWEKRTNAKAIFVKNSGHYIQKEQPDAVIAAIRGALPNKEKSNFTP